MAIRPAVDADVPGIRECVRAAYAVYLGRLDLPPEPLSHDYAAQVRDHLTHVEVDGTVRGVLVLFDRADHLFVENLAVHPADQGRGIGSRLLDYSANRARGLGRAELRLCTNE
ncbi:MAG: GNAT family N-acetyltransferase, partial [Thermoplasmata archaeon]